MTPRTTALEVSVTSAASDGAPSGHAYYVLAMLFFVLATSLIDRNILGILLEDIKANLQITDTQIGWLTGPAFAVTNAIAGIPLRASHSRGSRIGGPAVESSPGDYWPGLY